MLSILITIYWFFQIHKWGNIQVFDGFVVFEEIKENNSAILIILFHFIGINVNMISALNVFQNMIIDISIIKWWKRLLPDYFTLSGKEEKNYDLHFWTCAICKKEASDWVYSFSCKNCGYGICLNCYEKNIRKEDGDCCNVI